MVKQISPGVMSGGSRAGKSRFSSVGLAMLFHVNTWPDIQTEHELVYELCGTSRTAACLIFYWAAIYGRSFPGSRRES